MKIMGIWAPRLQSSCRRSRPLIPGSCTSSTRQLRASEGQLVKNSWAEANACTLNPEERSKLRTLSRTEDSSSITQTRGLFSFMVKLLANRDFPAIKPNCLSHVSLEQYRLHRVALPHRRACTK